MKPIPLSFEGFPGGLNTESDPTSLEVNELTEALNVRIGNKGEIARRPGYTQWSAGVPGVVEYLHRWIEENGTRNAIAVDTAGDILVAKDDGWQFTPYGTLDYGGRDDYEKYPVGFAAGEDRLYISTLRRDKVRRWDGRSLHEVMQVHQNTDPDDVQKEEDADGNPIPTVYRLMPSGQHLVYRHGRMYVGHTAANKSRIWFSNVLLPEAYSEESWVDLDPEDGTTITAMLSYADELFIFKDNSMWEMTGRDPTTYSLRTVDKLRGTVSPKTVCQMRGLLVFFDRDTGLWGYNGSELTLLSEKINGYLLKGLDYGKANTAAAYFGNDRLYLSVPWMASGKRRTFVMNAQNGAWSEYDSGFIIGDYYHNERFQSYDHRSGFLRANENTDTVAGEEYESFLSTPWFFPLGPGVKARMRRLEMVVQGRQGAEVRIDLYRDMQDKHWHVHRAHQMQHDNIDIPRMLSPAIHPTQTITLDGWGKRLHSMKLRIQLEYLPMQLNRMSVFVTGGEDLRGERH